jgi:hypothetical protein
MMDVAHIRLELGMNPGSLDGMGNKEAAFGHVYIYKDTQENAE